MIRTFLALSAGLMCALAGMRHAGRTKARLSRLQRWQEVLCHLALLLEEGAGSLPEVLALCACEDTEPDRILRALSLALTEDPLCAPEKLVDLSALPREEQQPLRRMASRLGRGSRESRVQAVSSCAKELGLLADASRPRADADAKMWRQLGLIGGACLTLWLI